MFSLQYLFCMEVWLGLNALGGSGVALSSCETQTFKQGTEVPPAGDAALGCVLPHGCLQEEHRDATGKQKQDVGNQKCT